MASNRSGLTEELEQLIRQSPVLQRAVEEGVDLTLLIERLSLSPTERLIRHQEALAVFEEFRRAGQRKRGEI